MGKGTILSKRGGMNSLEERSGYYVPPPPLGFDSSTALPAWREVNS